MQLLRLCQLVVRVVFLLFSPLMRYVMFMGFQLLRFVLGPMTRIWSLSCRPKRLPPLESPIITKSATALAAMIRKQEVSCLSVVETYITRIKAVNPLLNALVDERFNAALEEARQVDELIASGVKTEEQLARETPLLGIPLTVKESIPVQGLSNNAARSRVGCGHKATRDAECVRLMRQAGAIVLAVSNTPELCLSWETNNNVVGRTNNPYDTRRTPGGSSGGEAALLGAGASLIGLASDIGGSLRLPAMFTGVYGHKPTPGFVSNEGHVPTATDPAWNRFFTLGPMARYAEDLPLLLDTIVTDREKVKQLKLFEPVELRHIKVYYMETNGGKDLLSNDVDQEVRRAMRRALEFLEIKHGVTTKLVHISGMEDVIEMCALILLRMKGVENIFQKDDNHPDDWNSVVFEFLKWIVFRSTASMSSLLYGPAKAIVDRVPEDECNKSQQKRKRLMDTFEQLLGEDSVFFYPTFPDVANLHYQMYYKFFSTTYMCLFNLLEMPVLACPLGCTRAGLPVGMQIAASQCQDRLSFTVAKALEKEFGQWQPPPSENT